jgi:DNA-binding transcriptional regulator YiaG
MSPDRWRMEDDCEDVLRLSWLRRLVLQGEAVAVRERARLSRIEIAAYCGVDYKTIRRWESGERAPKGAGALRYARLLAALVDVEQRAGAAA